MRRTPVFVAVLLLIGGRVALAQEADVATLITQSKPEIQEQIKRTYDAFRKPRVDLKTDCVAFEEVQKLKDITKDKGELVRQLATFVVTTESEEYNHVMLAAIMLDFLELPPSIPIRGFAPYLDTKNDKLRFFVRMWFSNHDTGSHGHELGPLRSVNYYNYMEYVRSRVSRNEEVPSAFTEYIYSRHPGRALLVFAYAHQQAGISDMLRLIGEAVQARRQGRELTQDEIRQRQEEKRQIEKRQQQAKKELSKIRLAEHVISDAIWLKENGFDDRFQRALPEASAELAKLAKHKEWWARLYVLYVMRKHPELRQADVLQQLRGDSNAFVSKTAQSVKE